MKTKMEIDIRDNTYSAKHLFIRKTVRDLAVICKGEPEKIIDSLTGYLWEEEEAGLIKMEIRRDEVRKERSKPNDIY